jgi:hypothetical protein
MLQNLEIRIMAKPESTKITQSWRGRKLINSFTGIAGFEKCEVILDTDRVSTCQHLAAERHGWEAKVLDVAAVAIYADKEKTQYRTAVDVSREKLANIKEIVAWFHSGVVEWNRKGGSAPWSPDEDLVGVVAVMRKVAVERAREFLLAAGEDVCKAIAADTTIAAKVAEAIRARSTVKVEDILAKLAA